MDKQVLITTRRHALILFVAHFQFTPHVQTEPTKSTDGSGGFNYKTISELL